jgi:hypothetical protein
MAGHSVPKAAAPGPRRSQQLALGKPRTANELISQLRSAELGWLAESSADFWRQMLNGVGHAQQGTEPSNARGLVRAVWQVHVTGADG